MFYTFFIQEDKLYFYWTNSIFNKITNSEMSSSQNSINFMQLINESKIQSIEDLDIRSDLSSISSQDTGKFNDRDIEEKSSKSSLSSSNYFKIAKEL